MDLYKIVDAQFRKHYYEDTDVFEKYWKFHHRFWQQCKDVFPYGICAYKCVPSVSGQSISWKEIRRVP